MNEQEAFLLVHLKKGYYLPLIEIQFQIDSPPNENGAELFSMTVQFIDEILTLQNQRIPVPSASRSKSQHHLPRR